MSFLSDKIWRLLKRGKTTFVYSYATKSGGNDENKKQDDFDIFDYDRILFFDGNVFNNCYKAGQCGIGWSFTGLRGAVIKKSG